MKQTDSFSNIFSELTKRSDSLLRKEIDSLGGGAPSQLTECLAHSVLGGGKRIRPVLCFGAASAIGVPLERLDRFAVSLELVHAASLIHDDLPALDDDDERRGKPTAHKLFGEGLAVIAGDFLIARASGVICEDSELSPDIKVSLLTTLSDAVTKLCIGQAIDIKKAQEPGENSEKVLLECAEKKTGALFEAAARAPAFFLPNGSGEGAALRQFGRAFGVVFQLTDDLLDADRGRETEWPNAVVILGRERTAKLIDAHVEDALSAITCFGDRGAFLEQLLRKVCLRSE